MKRDRNEKTRREMDIKRHEKRDRNERQEERWISNDMKGDGYQKSQGETESRRHKEKHSAK